MLLLAATAIAGEWRPPKPVFVDTDGKPVAGMGTSLCYLGKGNVLLYGGSRWFSRDCGQTWKESVPLGPASDGKPWYTWDPPLVEQDAKTGKISTILLPDGSILTAFGTGYRCQDIVKNQPAPRDVGLVCWRLNPGAVNAERRLRDAPFDSSLRSIYNLEHR